MARGGATYNSQGAAANVQHANYAKMIVRGMFPSAYDSGLSRLRVRTIVRLRWIAVLGQTAAVLGVHGWLGFELPIAPCMLVIALSAAMNGLLRYNYPARELMQSSLAAIMLGYDLLQLSVLLYLTGGLQNPFALLIIAPVTIAAYTQPARTTISLGGLAILCVSLLVFYQEPLPWFPGESMELPLVYVAGVWVALVSGVIFFAIYAWRIAKETLQMTEALAATETALQHEQKISALDGLAAAAAHELGTPLGTISVVTKELLRETPGDSPLREDIELLRAQAERCRDILGRLSRSSGEADMLHSPAPLTDLLGEAVQPYLTPEIDIKVVAHPREGTDREPVAARNPGIVYGLGNLVENAADFAAKSVHVEAEWDERTVSVTIRDDGPGFALAVLNRLGEPYLTSRPGFGMEGAAAAERTGLGLGFFIAKTLLERSGARLEFTNRTYPETGAVVTVRWPREAIEAAVEQR